MDTETRQRLAREYHENRIRAAQPIERTNILYQVAIESLNQALGHLKTNDRFARSRAVTRAEQAVQELLLALDHSVDASLTRNLENLYRYSLSRIIAGHSQQSEQAFREALSVLTTLAVAFRKVEEEICGSPQPAEGGGDQPAESKAPVKDPYSGYQQDREKTGARSWSG